MSIFVIYNELLYNTRKKRKQKRKVNKKIRNRKRKKEKETEKWKKQQSRPCASPNWGGGRNGFNKGARLSECTRRHIGFSAFRLLARVDSLAGF